MKIPFLISGVVAALCAVGCGTRDRGLEVSGAVAASYEAEGPAESADSSLVSDVPEVRPSDYEVVGDAVYAYASIGDQAGLFRFSTGSAAPVFIDGITRKDSSRNLHGFPQISGGVVYYVASAHETVDGKVVSHRELMRVGPDGVTREKVSDVPQGYIAVGRTRLYVVSGHDEHTQIASRALEGGPLEVIAEKAEVPRDFVTVGDALYWRENWAGLTENSLELHGYRPGGAAKAISLGKGRIELQRVLVSGERVFALGDHGRLWSIDVGNDAATELPSLGARMNEADVDYCGDEYPYGHESSVIAGDTLYAHCRSWGEQSRRFILAFPLSGETARVVTPMVTSTRAWYFRASDTQLFWLEKTGYDRHTLRAAPL